MEIKLRAEGKIDGASAAALVESMSSGDFLNVVDFKDVESVNFAALRTFLNAAKSGKRIWISNVAPEVAELFDDSGVSHFVSIVRRPKPIDVSKFEEFGGGFLSKSYNNPDGDSMIKFYNARVDRLVTEREKLVARSVLLFGINTPLVGSMYTSGDGTALEFERIQGKRSFSRIISEEPERLEEMTVRFARMCLDLHATQCDTSVFPDKRIFYRDSVSRCADIDDNLRKRILEFIDSRPAATTCLHGDMQLSNVITAGAGDMWIDLSDFSYGDPMFDLGMWYFLSQLNPEHLLQHIFHLNKEQMDRIWEIFAREYFGADTPGKQEEVRRRINPYAALHMLYLGENYGFEPGMLQFVAENFS